MAYDKDKLANDKATKTKTDVANDQLGENAYDTARNTDYANTIKGKNNKK